MDSPAPATPKKPLTGAVILGLLILAAALVWRFYGPQLLALARPPEKIQPVVFTPASATLADRARFALTTSAGPEYLSTTLPVQVSVQKIAFGQGLMPAPVVAPSNLPNTTAGTDADELPPATLPISAAWLVKYTNSQLCNAHGACPIALLTQSGDDRLVQGVLFATTAKNLWVSNRRTNGNPDLLVDYGIPGQAPVRLGWRTDGEFPLYTFIPGPLPEALQHAR